MAPPLAGHFFSSHDMDSNYQYPNLDEARQIKPSTAPYLTPYLGPRSRLSQVWFNRWTLLLSLIVVRVYLSAQSIDSDLDSAQREALSACTAVERAGSAMASMPHYMAPGVNELTARGVEGGVRALEKTLLMSITVVREIVVFIINAMVQTYVCLITLAIAGSIGVIVNVTQEIGDFVNTTVKGIIGDFDKEIGDFENTLNGKVQDIKDSIKNFFGGDINLPQLNLPALDKLKDFTIPTGFDENLQKLKDSIPDFKEVKEAGDNAIRFPFELIQKKINASFGTYELDRSIFPIPQKEKLTFCSDNNDINDFFGSLRHKVATTKTVVIGVALGLAVAVMLPMAWLELRRWRLIRQRAYMFGSANYDPVDITYLASRPSTGTWGLRVASLCKSERRQVLLRWAVAYVTSPPALFMLSLGVAGLAGAIAQLVVLKQVEKAAPELSSFVGGFAGEVVDLLNQSSVKFATTTNMVMQNVTDQLNEDVFGWLTDGTQTLNDTLNAFTAQMEKGIDKFLGGTILEKPAADVIYCFIGLKIESLQKGLTWLHDNAKISFPAVPEDTFSVGALNSLDGSGTGSDSFLSDPQGASSDMITDTIFKLTGKWKDGLMTEATISGVVVMVWVFVGLIALVRTACLWWGKNRVRGNGGGRGTNFTGAAQGAPPFSNVRESAYGAEDALGIRQPKRSFFFKGGNWKGSKAGSAPEEYKMGVVNSKREVPEPIGGWGDEKRGESWQADFED